MATPPRERIIAALDEVWASTAALLETLDESDWSLPSPLAGWDVRDNVSHIIGTELMLLGEPTPEVKIDRDVATHVRNDIGELNEMYVESMRELPYAEVLKQFTSVTSRRLDALHEMGDDEWNAESVTPVGMAPYGRFMQIRVFDCWLHEQDIRDATGRPGDESGLAAEVTVDEMSTALGFVVGKKAGVGPGNRVTFSLTDGGAVVRQLHVDVGERAAVVDELSEPATVVLTMPVGVMTRRSAGRVAADELLDQITIEGDAELAQQILVSQAYTI